MSNVSEDGNLLVFDVVLIVMRLKFCHCALPIIKSIEFFVGKNV